MVRSGFDKSSGLYWDCTTDTLYTPKEYCEICGANFKPLEIHHYLPQQRCERDKKSKVIYPSTWTQEFINENQKLFTVCRECHNAIHAKGRKKVINGRDLRNYLWQEEKTEVVTKPKAFVVKKNEH